MMLLQPTPTQGLVVTATVAGLGGIALHATNLYGVVSWWDDAGHALSGFAVAAIVFLLGAQLVSGPARIPLTLGGVLVVGLAWEVVEVRYFGERAEKGPSMWLEDTKLDLALEVIVTLVLLLVDAYVPLA